LREREASGDRPWREKAATRVLRSIGERGEAGDARRDRPTGPIGEHGIREERAFRGDSGGNMEALRKSRGVTGDRNSEGGCCRTD
jgi:hypothetical protein